MVVTMVAMWMVKVSIDDVANVIAVWDGLMATSGSVNVVRVVTIALMVGGAGIRVLL